MSYPSSIDSFTTKATGETVQASHVDDLQNSIVAIETELGTLPKGGAADVKTRIENAENKTASIISQQADGWIPVVDSWTYSSADSPIFVITVPSDATLKYSVGMRIKLTQTTVKYFIIHAVTSTTLTVYGGTDYTLAVAAITSIYYSREKCPFAFPLSPSKWEVLVTDTTQRSAACAAAWLNLNSAESIVIPIGIWDVEYNVHLQLYSPTADGCGYVTLSTANNTQSDASMTAAVQYTPTSAGANVSRKKTLSIASKTTYYLNTSSDNTNGSKYNRNDISPLYIRARCVYL
jgi:hypothetical protein